MKKTVSNCDPHDIEFIQNLIDLHIEYRAGVPSNRELMWEQLGKLAIIGPTEPWSRKE